VPSKRIFLTQTTETHTRNSNTMCAKSETKNAIASSATNNNSISTVSIPVGITVNKPNTDGFCGTSVNGDYEYNV